MTPRHAVRAELRGAAIIAVAGFAGVGAALGLLVYGLISIVL